MDSIHSFSDLLKYFERNQIFWTKGNFWYWLERIGRRDIQVTIGKLDEPPVAPETLSDYHGTLKTPIHVVPNWMIWKLGVRLRPSDSEQLFLDHFVADIKDG